MFKLSYMHKFLLLLTISKTCGHDWEAVQFNVHSVLIIRSEQYHTFFIVGIKARLMLAALAWNYRPHRSRHNPVTSDIIGWRGRKCWVLSYRPMLMQWVIAMYRENIILPPITRPAEIKIAGYHVPKPKKENLLVTRISRFPKNELLFLGRIGCLAIHANVLCSYTRGEI